jgi:uncharacterized SAM-binding protein YcdF (DUF218 family)
MFFTLSKIIDFILLPISWILISLVLGIWKKNTKMLYAALGMLVLFTNGYFVNQLYRWYELPQTILQPNQKFTYGVVLGGGYIKNPQEDPNRINVGETADRMLQPILLYKSGVISKIIITGGDTSIKGLRTDEIRETAQATKFMRAMGVDSADIIQEGKARNTHENATYTRDILNKTQEPILLITSAAHMRRSLACFEKVGLQPVAYPVDHKKKDSPMGVLEWLMPSENHLARFSQLVREIFGYVIYKLNGYA